MLYEFRDHDGFAGAILGRAGAAYHLAFVHKAEIFVRDIRRSRAFYEQLGFEVLADRGSSSCWPGRATACSWTSGRTCPLRPSTPRRTSESWSPTWMACGSGVLATSRVRGRCQA